MRPALSRMNVKRRETDDVPQICSWNRNKGSRQGQPNEKAKHKELVCYSSTSHSPQSVTLMHWGKEAHGPIGQGPQDMKAIQTKLEESNPPTGPTCFTHDVYYSATWGTWRNLGPRRLTISPSEKLPGDS